MASMIPDFDEFIRDPENGACEDERAENWHDLYSKDEDCEDNDDYDDDDEFWDDDEGLYCWVNRE